MQHVNKDFVTVGGLRTCFWHAGTGPTLLMLHGQLPGSCVPVEWGDHISRFAAAGFSVYAPDVAGFGETDNPSDYHIETRIAHLRAFVEHLGLKQYSVWGSSMGSYMGCAMALTDPQLDKLILMPSTVLPPDLPGQPWKVLPGSVSEILDQYTPSPANARALMERAIYNHDVITESLVQLFCENSTGKNIEAFRGRQAVGRPKPLYPELVKLKNKALLLWGLNDMPERALLLQQAFPGSELHMLPNCKHWPQVDQSARSFDLVRAFLGV